VRPRIDAFVPYVRRHRLLAGAFVLGVGLRALVLVTYEPAGLLSADSYQYLTDAHRFKPGPEHPFGYPGFLSVLLPLGNLAAIPLVQHALGLGIGVALYALVRRLGAGPVAATVGALPWLLDGLVLNLEQYVMAETLFVALVIAGLAALCWHERLSIRAAAGAGLLLGFGALTRTTGLALIVPAAAYVLGPRLGRKQAATLVSAFALPVLVYAVAYWGAFGVFGLTSIDGYVLYGRVAPFAKCEGAKLTAYERALCDPRPVSKRPGPNYYVSYEVSPLRRLEPPPGETRNGAGRAFFYRIVLHQPGEYVRTIGSDLAHYAKPERKTGRRDFPYRVWRFADVYARPDLRREATRRYGGTDRLLQGPAHVLESYGRAAFTPGPVLALALALALVGGVAGRRRGTSRSLRGECLLFGSAGFVLLLVPAATAVFDYRFVVPVLALLPPAGALGATVLVERLKNEGRR
jgi:hypothetical protein